MKLIEKISTIFLIVTFAAMAALAFLQVILRNFFESGIGWADVTVRHLVLWSGFFGAIIATIQKRHITLDIFSRLLPVRIKNMVQILIHLGATIGCGALAYASCKFVATSHASGEILFGYVPIWLAQVVIPITFGLIGILFFLECYALLTSFRMTNIK